MSGPTRFDMAKDFALAQFPAAKALVLEQWGGQKMEWLTTAGMAVGSLAATPGFTSTPAMIITQVVQFALVNLANTETIKSGYLNRDIFAKDRFDPKVAIVAAAITGTMSRNGVVSVATAIISALGALGAFLNRDYLKERVAYSSVETAIGVASALILSIPVVRR